MATPKNYREVQDTLGDRFIASVRAFISEDLESISTLMGGKFKHVSDRDHREAIAQMFYEGRWIYKAGLALLVQDDAQSAHVRAQAFNYGSVCEGLLKDVEVYALSKGLFKGNYVKFIDPPKCSRPASAHHRHSFHNLILIAGQEHIISADLARRLHSLRKDRNSVHTQSSTGATLGRFYLGRGMRYYQTVIDTVSATKDWKAHN